MIIYDYYESKKQKRKIIVIGCPGSGKSTFSRKLHHVMGIPLFHLDMLYWNSDKTTVDKDIFKEKLYNIIEKDEWIIDGNYGATIEVRLNACDTAFFLDYPLEICLKSIAERKGKTRSDMPWVESENDDDSDFIEYVKNYNSHTKPDVMDLLSKYSYKNIYIFKNRNEADEFLNQLCI